MVNRKQQLHVCLADSKPLCNDFLARTSFGQASLEFATLSAFMICIVFASTAPATAQDASPQEPPIATSDDAPTGVPEKVDVEPIAEDEDIATRLTRILDATEWFQEPAVRVDEGVVFLTGRGDSEQHREWAGRLAGNTQDVVAVVNRITVIEKSMWDLSPAWFELKELAAVTVRNSPLIGVGLLLLVATWFATKLSARGAFGSLSRPRKESIIAKCHGASRGGACVLAGPLSHT